MNATRRNFYIPDELYGRVVRSAGQQTVDTGEPVSIAEWVRVAIKQRLEREELTQGRPVKF